MKKVLSVILLNIMLIIPGAMAVDSIVDPVNWNLRAVATTTDDLYKKYCVTTANELYSLSDYIFQNIRQQHPLTIQQVAAYCVNNSILGKDIKLGSTDEAGQCSGQPKGDGCTEYMRKLIQNQNSINKVAGDLFTQAGTYVIQVKPDVYRVYTFVPGTGKSIFIIRPDQQGKFQMVGKLQRNGKDLETATNQMFKNVNNKYGNKVVGVFTNSYIFPGVDLTDLLDRLAVQDKGALSYAVMAGFSLFADGASDIKAREDVLQYRMTDADAAGNEWIQAQSDTDAHVNGFIYGGEVYTAEALGHVLAGRIQALAEDEVPKKLSDAAVHMYGNSQQMSTSEIVAPLAAGLVTGRPIEGGALAVGQLVAGTGEPPDNNALRDEAYQRQLAASKITQHFKETETKTPEEARKMAANYLSQQGVCASYARATVYCKTSEDSCNIVGQDIVECWCGANPNGQRFYMEFGDICD